MKTSVVCRLSSAVVSLAALALLLAGCSSYRWRSSVPEELRSVAVPVFENRTSSAELGPIVTQYVLREFQREGTFSIRRSGSSALEVQGSIVKASRSAAAFDRGYGSRASEYRYTVTAEVSLVNRDTGKVLMNNVDLVPVTVSSGLQQPVTDFEARLAKAFPDVIMVDAAKIADEVGNARTMNMVIAGALSALVPFEESKWIEAMEQMLTGPKAKLLPVNKEAFARGRKVVLG